MNLNEIAHDMRETARKREELGVTQAIRLKRARGKAEWYCSNYDGNTIFFDSEIIKWAEMPQFKESEK